MRYLSHIKNPVETVRSAPLGFLLNGANLTFASFNAHLFLESDSIIERVMLMGAFAISGMGMSRSNSLIKRQIDLKERLESSIEKP